MQIERENVYRKEGSRDIVLKSRFKKDIFFNLLFQFQYTPQGCRPIVSNLSWSELQFAVSKTHAHSTEPNGPISHIYILVNSHSSMISKSNFILNNLIKLFLIVLLNLCCLAYH